MININEIINKDYISGENLLRENRNDILNKYFNANSLELPIVTNNKLIGTLLLKDYISGDYTINNNIFTYIITSNELEVETESIEQYSQNIIPFVAQDKTYKGFIQKTQFNHLKDIKAIAKEVYRYEVSESQFNILFKNSYEGLITTDEHGTLTNLNSSFENMYDLDSESFIGKHFTSLPDSCSPILSAISNIFEYKKSQDITSIDSIENKSSGIVQPVFIDELFVGTVAMIRNLSFDSINSISSSLTEGTFIGSNEKIEKIINLVHQISQVNTPVLINGESGVGKTTLGKFIHANSSRKAAPFIEIDCAILPEKLIESELFGLMDNKKPCLFELANEGTLLINHIDNLSLSHQIQLLDILKNNKLSKPNGFSLDLNLRSIATTTKNLPILVSKGQFSKDLFYYLNVIEIEIPPLRERTDDIEILIYKFINIFNTKYNMTKSLDKETLYLLSQFNWPGNLNELKNIIERLIVTSPSATIDSECLPESIKSFKDEFNDIDFNHFSSLKESVNDFEKHILMAAKVKSSNTQSMARLLKLDRSTITRKLNKYNL